MAYDGLFIHSHIQQLKKQLIGQKIEKIYQPQPYEILFSFRGKTKQLLLFSIASQNPRFLLTSDKPQMPEKAPIFCMFLRKHLGGAILQDIRQYGLERIVFFDFIAKNELGDDVKRTICIEIMGKHSNFILLEDDIIKDALKRVSRNMSVREIYGGIPYQLPPTLKHNPIEFLQKEDAFRSLKSAFNSEEYQNKTPVKFLNSYFQGLSNSSSQAIVTAAQNTSTPLQMMNEEEIQRLYQSFCRAMEDFTNYSLYEYRNQNDKILEISTIALPQLQNSHKEVKAQDFDHAISQYFNDANDINMYSSKKADLEKKLLNLIQKLEKRMANIQLDIDKYDNYKEFKLYGELLFANLYMIKPGAQSVVLLNYYNNEEIEIPMNAMLSPGENANSYFKKYNKAKATIEHSQKNMVAAREELDYLNSIRHYIAHIESYEDIDNIVEELQSQGYIQVKKSRKQNSKVNKFNPIKYRSSAGHEIWVGKNNIQNDMLTLKKSNKEFIWLHVKDIAGSHVVIQNSFENVTNECIYEAARIAAYHSGASESSNVPVDFTEIKYVHKPSGAKPGMVIFTDNKTVYVTPNHEEIERLKQK